jgi:hypothetical protein
MAGTVVSLLKVDPASAVPVATADAIRGFLADLEQAA